MLLWRCLACGMIAFVVVHRITPSRRRRQSTTTTADQIHQHPRYRQHQQQQQHPYRTTTPPTTRRLQDTTNTNSTSTQPYTVPTDGTEALRSRLLQNYDRFSYPIEEFWARGGDGGTSSTNWTTATATSTTTLRTGLPVQVGLNFHRVFAVAVTKSTVDLIVWVRLSWQDPRLTWDPAAYNNIRSLHFWIGDGMGTGEQSEIWSPDVHLWNAAEPLVDTLADAHAIVTSDGTVFWTRPGHVRPACKFEGLSDFPFDTLQCTMEFGSWGYSGLYLRPTKLEDGYSIGGTQTAGEAYAEFSLDSVSVEEFGTSVVVRRGMLCVCVCVCVRFLCLPLLLLFHTNFCLSIHPTFPPQSIPRSWKHPMKIGRYSCTPSASPGPGNPTPVPFSFSKLS